MTATATAVAQAKAGRRKRKHEEHEEHENHERWLVTYADMITLLMVLFIVLFAIGQTDLDKFRRLQQGLHESFGNRGALDAAVLDGTTGLLPNQSDVSILQLTDARAAIAARDAARRLVAEDRVALEQTAATIDARLTAAGVHDNVALRIDHRGLIVTIVTDEVLFAPGSDRIGAVGEAIVTTIAAAVTDLPNRITVEGHTDDRPISTGRFASNWELSTARATSVLRLLLASSGVPPGQLSAAGYADTRPIADNGTAEGRAANRRVEIVVHSRVGDSSVVADVAGTDTPPTTFVPILDPIPEVTRHGEEEAH